MPRPRFKKLDEEKKKLILDVASEEFANHGYEKASYNAIIEKCNLSKGVMYYYFDDKRDLFNTIINEANESYLDFIGVWKECGKKEEYWAQIRELFLKSIAFFDKDPRAARLVSMSLKSPDILSETYKQLEHSATGWFTDVLKQGQSLSAVRDDIPMDYLVKLVFGFGQASDQWMLSKWESSSQTEMMQDIDTVFNLLVEFLSPKN